MERTQIARSASEMDRLRSAWEHLYSNSRTATQFQSFAWNRLAAACFADRESPYIVLAETDSGAALIPASITRSGLSLLGEAMFDYRDLLSIGSEDALQAAWGKLAELNLPLAITALRGEETRNHWLPFPVAAFTAAPQILQTEITADAFLSQHSRLLRTLRRMADHGIEFRTHPGTASDLVAHIYQLKAQQIKSAENVFLDPVRREFMVAICAVDSMCQLYTLESPGCIAAALVTFRDGQVMRFYTIYFDHGWAQYSPGTALLFAVTRQALAEGLDCDYMTGEQPHKRRFMTSSVPLFRVNTSCEVLEAAAGLRAASF